MTCPRCNRTVSLKRDGTMRAHRVGNMPCPGDARRVEAISLPWTSPPLTANEQRRMHPLKEAGVKRAMLTDARWAIRAARITPIAYADVTLHWRMPDRRRRDGDGAAPTLKVVLDALVHEGVLYDDSWICVRHSGVTTHHPEPGMPGGMWVAVEEVTE